MRRALPALLAVVLVSALAGCSGLTPPTDPGSELPPGVTERGVDDPDALLDAHLESLRSVSYGVSDTFVSRSNSEWPDVRVEREIEFAADPSRYRMRSVTVLDRSTSRDTRTIELWSNGTAIAARRTNGELTTYEGTTDAVGLFYPEPTPAEYTESLYVVLATANLSVVAATGEDEILLGGSIPHESAGIARTVDRSGAPRGTTYADASVRLIVTDRGLIKWWRVSWTTITDEHRVRESRTVRLRELGSADVDRPPWVAQALANETSPTEVPGPLW